MTSATCTVLLDRVATAPISWGVCEVPGWGHQLPAEQVLAEMSAAGFTHTELGSWGYLPTEPDQLRAALDRHGLKLIGGFVPLVLHRSDRGDSTAQTARRYAELIAGAGGRFFVTCAISHEQDWRQAPLSEQEWATLCDSLATVDAIAQAHGLAQVFHPHFGTVVETDAELNRVLEGSDVALALDTAHLTLGGTDLVALLEHSSARVGLVHIKDVDDAVATRLGTGELSLMQAVQQGLFPPLGQGTVPLAEVVSTLEAAGLGLWYVIEQDAAIADGDPAALAGLRHNADASLAFLKSLSAA